MSRSVIVLLVQRGAIKNSPVGARDELVCQMSFVVECEQRPPVST